MGCVLWKVGLNQVYHLADHRAAVKLELFAHSERVFAERFRRQSVDETKSGRGAFVFGRSELKFDQCFLRLDIRRVGRRMMQAQWLVD